MNKELIELRDNLADKYTDNKEIVLKLRQLGVDVKTISFTSKPLTTWHSIVTYCMHQNKLHLLQNL